MTLARPQRRIWAAQARVFSTAARARRIGSALASMTTWAVLGLLVVAAPASAVIISAGPTTSPGGGWSCTTPASGPEKLAGGQTYTCTGTAGAFSSLYVGINKNTSSP